MAEKEIRNPSGLISKTWSKDPAKLAVFRAMASCQARLGPGGFFSWDIADALAQRPVSVLYSYSLEVEEVHY